MNKGILFVTGLVLSVLVMSGMVMAGPSNQGANPEADVAATVTVPGYISLTLSKAPTWLNLIPGDPERLADDASSLTIFIGPETNSGVKINTRAEGNFVSGTNTISFERMKYQKFDGAGVPSDEAYALTFKEIRSISTIDHDTGLTFVSQHKMSIERGQAASQVGSPYTTKILIQAEAAA